MKGAAVPEALNPTRDELAEILSQLDVPVPSDAPIEEICKALEDIGMTDELIAQEVKEQRGRY